MEFSLTSAKGAEGGVQSANYLIVWPAQLSKNFKRDSSKILPSLFPSSNYSVSGPFIGTEYKVDNNNPYIHTGNNLELPIDKSQNTNSTIIPKRLMV